MEETHVEVVEVGFNGGSLHDKVLGHPVVELLLYQASELVHLGCVWVGEEREKGEERERERERRERREGVYILLSYIQLAAESVLHVPVSSCIAGWRAKLTTIRTLQCNS